MRPIDAAIVAEYEQAMIAGDVFPPMDVFHDGKTWWLGDGFHRYRAYEATKKPATMRLLPGGLREAKLHGIEASNKHGLRPTLEQRLAYVALLLADPEWSQWSDGTIAGKCGVVRKTVLKMRAANGSAEGAADEAGTCVKTQVESPSEPPVGGASSPGKTRKYTDKKGETKEINVEEIGKKSKPKPKPEQPAPPPAVTDEERANFKAEVRRLQSRNDEVERALAAEDKGQEIEMLLRRVEHAERMRQQSLGEAAGAERQMKFYQGQLARIGRMIGIKDLDAVAPAVEAILRKVKNGQKVVIGAAA